MNAFTPVSDAALALQSLAQKRAANVKVGGIKGIAVGRSDEFRVNPFDIDVVGGFNVRSFGAEPDEDDIHLSEDIARRGVRNPVLVRLSKTDGRLKLVNGERRLRATIRALNLGLEGSENLVDIPVKMIPAGKSDLDIQAEQYVQNTDDLRKDFSDLDAARGLHAFVQHEWDEHKIAAKTGMKLTRVRRLLAILELPVAVTAFVEKGVISATQALETYRETGTSEAAVERIEAGITAANARGSKKVTRKHIDRENAPAKATPRTLIAKAKDELSTLPVEFNEADGTASIVFASPEKAAEFRALFGL
jgi:ParB-like chromosome segregation protein Spo0J